MDDHYVFPTYHNNKVLPLIYIYVYTCIFLQETYKIFIEISFTFELLTSQIDHKAFLVM